MTVLELYMESGEVASTDAGELRSKSDIMKPEPEPDACERPKRPLTAAAAKPAPDLKPLISNCAGVIELRVEFVCCSNINSALKSFWGRGENGSSDLGVSESGDEYGRKPAASSSFLEAGWGTVDSEDSSRALS
ncbi:hypothetical protein OGATHE_000545 [Ogataea polymorpha]|uniref:Uncharacterized protein n=1 Tax=Ogataea polymorpha TaxID=460523 RepID=A0A9P8PTB6_9ASCO|nr:hypothetical protein OGATHE_000545 [Ogataea polymorpha]